MGLLANIKAAFSPARYFSASIRNWSGIGRGSNPRPFNYDRAIKEFHSWGYAAAMINANAFASTPKRLFVRDRKGIAKKFECRGVPTDLKRFFGGRGPVSPSTSVARKFAQFGGDVLEVVEPHPALETLRKANPFFNGFELEVLRMLDLQMTGNAYLHVVDGAARVPAEVWRMPSQWTEIIESRTEYVAGYRYGREPDTQTFDTDEVIHFKIPNPANLFYGKGWYEAAWKSLGLHESKREQDLAKFDNYARPDWLIGVPGGNKDAMDKLEKGLTSKFRSANGRENSSFLTLSADVKATALNWDVPEVGTATRVIEEVAAISGVPVAMVHSNDATYAGSSAARVGYYRNTIQTYCRLDEEKLNEKWTPRFGDGDDLFIAHDPASFEDMTATGRRISELVSGGVLTQNEGRAELGYPPHADGDALYAPRGATGGGSVGGGNNGNNTNGN